MNNYRELEARTQDFLIRVIQLCKKIPPSVIVTEIIRQLIRSSGSVGANYREANEGLSKRDTTHRLRISRKEAKETTYWLEALKEAAPVYAKEIMNLIRESKELRNILSAIISKIAIET